MAEEILICIQLVYQLFILMANKIYTSDHLFLGEC